MEKRTPAYELKEIQIQMSTRDGLKMTFSARAGLVEKDWDDEIAIEVIQKLTRNDFYKSMTCYHNNKVWQDVYHTSHDSIKLYVKFQRDEEGYFIVSFKEL